MTTEQNADVTLMMRLPTADPKFPEAGADDAGDAGGGLSSQFKVAVYHTRGAGVSAAAAWRHG